MTETSIHDLDGDNIRRARRAWKVERVGWVAMAMVVAAAVAGVFSEGPLSWSSAQQRSTGVELRYERFVRRGGPTSLDLVVPARHAERGAVAVWIDREYLNEVRIDDITPTPDSATGADGGVVYEFAVRDAAALEVSFDVTPDAIGFRTGRVGLSDKEPMRFRQAFYP